jgi:hypothetical protein
MKIGLGHAWPHPFGADFETIHSSHQFSGYLTLSRHVCIVTGISFSVLPWLSSKTNGFFLNLWHWLIYEKSHKM